MRRYKVKIQDKFITADYEVLALDPRDAVILVLTNTHGLARGVV